MSSASMLLKVVKSHTAAEVMNFIAEKQVKDKSKRNPPVTQGEEDHRDTPTVVVIDSTLTPLEAAKVLWNNNIMGAPVYDAKTKSYVGMFDVRDILSCVIAAHREFLALQDRHYKPGDDTRLPHEVEAHKKLQGELMAKALQNLKINSSRSAPGAITVSYLAARNPMSTYSKRDTLLEICKELERRGKHRVGIKDDSGTDCVGIISQSGMVAFLASQFSSNSLNEKMIDAGLQYKKDVVKISDEATAADAFELLDSKRLSGIAVVDEDGKLIANTSARDIKNAIMDGGQTEMSMDIISYLALVRQSEITKNVRHPSCHVHEDATVGHVVNLLAKTGYHRVFVVDKDMKPVGVVSFADIIRFMLEKGTD